MLKDITDSLMAIACDCDDAVAQDDGTSEGAKKGWEHRQHGGGEVVAPGGDLKARLQAKQQQRHQKMVSMWNAMKGSVTPHKTGPYGEHPVDFDTFSKYIDAEKKDRARMRMHGDNYPRDLEPDSKDPLGLARKWIRDNYSEDADCGLSPAMSRYLGIEETEDEGTSEGAKKGWMSRKQAMAEWQKHSDRHSQLSRYGVEAAQRGDDDEVSHWDAQCAKHQKEMDRLAKEYNLFPDSAQDSGTVDDRQDDPIDKVICKGICFKPDSAAQDAGTSEGAKKGWEKRKHAGTGIEIQNPDHEWMFHLYDKYGDELLDRRPMSPYESSSPRLQFESAYRVAHGRPIRSDWQDDVKSVLSESIKGDRPTVEQIDDFIDKISRPQSRYDEDHEGLNSDCPKVVTGHMKNLFPHYKDTSPRADDGVPRLSQASHIRGQFEKVKKLTPEAHRSHPVYKFLESAYEPKTGK